MNERDTFNIYKVKKGMDVEKQIIQHKARDAHPTVSFLNEYCIRYQGFLERENYEQFKYLHLGIIEQNKR